MDIKRYCAYDKLLQLAMQIIQIHPNITTCNPFKYDYSLPNDLANTYITKLYQMLIHSITCLHHREREQTPEGKYISEAEDNITALSLLQQILPLPKLTLCESEIILYKTLYEEYGTDKGFTTKEIVYKRYFKVETTKRIIKKLKQMGILRVEGNRYKTGYTYYFKD